MLTSRPSMYCIALLLPAAPAAAAPSPSFPDAKDDNVARIAADLEAVGREYLALEKPSDTQLTTMGYKFEHLEMRCNRLGGEGNRDLKPMLAMIRDFQKAVKARWGLEAKRRANERKPYVFGAISGPELSDGGHTAKGAEYLRNEVDQFVKHYRGLKHDKFSRNEVYLDHSRGYFRRTIEAAIETAERRIKDPKPQNVIIVGSAGGIVYDNYTPQENLLWSLCVARIAQDFESKVGGPAAPWVEWERKIRAVAASHKIALE